jgi:hypothetical protein
VVQSGVRIENFILEDLSEDLTDTSGQRRLIVTPAPHGHSRDAKRARCSAVAAKSDLKGKFVLSAGQPTLKSSSWSKGLAAPSALQEII